MPSKTIGEPLSPQAFGATPANQAGGPAGCRWRAQTEKPVGQRVARRWLDERATRLGAPLPGVHLAPKRAAAGEGASDHGAERLAEFVGGTGIDV
jgi:hypothetical protein